MYNFVLFLNFRTKDGKKWSPDDRRVKSKKDGEEIYILTFDDLNTEDSALYQATITNCEGSAETQGQITVNSKYNFMLMFFYI